MTDEGCREYELYVLPDDGGLLRGQATHASPPNDPCGGLVWASTKKPDSIRCERCGADWPTGSSKGRWGG